MLLAAGAAASPWEFHPHPEVWLLNAGLLIAYLAALRFWGPQPAPAGRPPVETWRKACFITGVIVLWLSADWPLHDISENHLFSAHMLQHLLYMFVVPPLLLLGLPAWLLRSLVGSGRRLRALRWVTRPVPALLISNAVIVFIHWPTIVDLQVTSEAGHLAIHALLLTGMMLMWWPVIPPLPETASPVAAGQDALPVPSIVHPHGAGVFLDLRGRAPVPDLRREGPVVGPRRGNRSADLRSSHEDRRRVDTVGRHRVFCSSDGARKRTRPRVRRSRGTTSNVNCRPGT